MRWLWLCTTLLRVPISSSSDSFYLVDLSIECDCTLLSKSLGNLDGQNIPVKNAAKENTQNGKGV